METSEDFLAVCLQPEAQIQYFCGTPAHHHAVEEDLEIVEHGADRFIDGKVQGDLLFSVSITRFEPVTA